MRLIAYFLSAALLLAVAAAKGTKAADPKYRLPTNVVPSHYSLDLVVDPENTHYTGFVEITFTAANVTDGHVRLHASTANYDVMVATVLFDYATACNVTHIYEEELLVLVCSKDTIDGEHRLTIEFTGKFSTDDMDGFYKSTYVEDDTEQVLVSTQFESSSARRAFPCFDDPSFKATFDVVITHPTEYSVLANTPVKEEYTVGTNQLQTQFERTPPMSTYLVAFVVSKFKENGARNDSGYNYKVYARPGAANYTSVATTYGPTLIDLLGDWTQIKYTDLGDQQEYLVAIPDFAAGAMENWGLVTFREVDLLDQGPKTSNSDKQRIITVIAHELSHMWFGDYVTLDWWSDTWLNEGFATYFENHIPDLLETEQLETAKQFVVDVVQGVLQDDALPSSRPLSGDDSKFDAISYDKGGSIVRMIKYILGESAFREGLHTYLQTNHYANTNPTKLLDALSTVAPEKLNVTQVLTDWIYKAGYPLVTVTLNDDGKSVNLKQERFISVSNSTVENTQWYVPISYTTSDERDFSVNIKTWLEPNTPIDITVSEGSWIIFNIQQAGFYRVNYDDKLWDRITAALNNKTIRTEIDVLNRAQLVDDIFNIARVGKVDYKKAFGLLEFLNTETEYYPWVSALNAISYLWGKLGDSEAETLLQNKTLALIEAAFPNIAVVSTSHVGGLTEALIWTWACKLEQEVCIEYAETTFEQYKTSDSLPDYNKREIVFCNALRNSENPSEDYEFLFDVFKASSSSLEQNVILRSLGCVSDSEVLLKYLSETIATNSPIRKQDASSVFRAVYTNSDDGVGVALKFLDDNLQKIADTYKGMGALSNLITGLASNVKKDEDIDTLKRIIADNDAIEDIQSVGQKALDIVSGNKLFTETYGAAIKEALKNEDTNNANISQPRFAFSVVLSLAAILLYV